MVLTGLSSQIKPPRASEESPMSFLASFSALSMKSALGVPSPKVPIDGTTFISYILPPLAGHFISAVLAVTPQTRTVRIALSPLVALLALRAVLSVDMSFGKANLNVDLVLLSFFLATRTLDWASVKGPLVRHFRPANSSPSAIMDALELVSNVRGHGWEWSHYRSYTPREAHSTNRISFVLYAFISGIAHILVNGASHRAVLALTRIGAGPIPGGSTIFDATLPLLVRHLRASVISILTALTIYGSTQMTYDLCSIPAVLLLGQDPAQWPPAFEAPWYATSLSDFWARRWHQWFRRIFFFLGGYPLSLVLGRTGIVIGSFLASAVMHHIVMISLNPRVEVWWMFIGFGMMGQGIILERAFHRLTGRKVGGVLGWIWTMTWLLLWGNMIIEGHVRAGIFWCTNPVDNEFPVRVPVEKMVADFDTWLHTI